MALTSEEVRHIARLARLGLSEEEIERMRVQLSTILEHFELLGEIDVSGVQPTDHTLPLTDVMRDDVAVDSLPVDAVKDAAPRTEGDYIRVRAVLE
ncbi:MAG: Asp-tRNA(Asn)/Glu-tRNA(Gln) amidotransferase subunit GatC [Dehalococcoidia bacterium]|nr:Asp-tRNA(Asn)/Glu-tRNA(Gln) amidotransferase subunit GatC [Dehalococcoidia bacterium]